MGIVEFEYDPGIFHVIGQPGPDFTLCGCSLDGDPETTGPFRLIHKPNLINCSRCIELIKFCKQINPKLYR